MNIIDDRTPQKRICSWVKKYKMFGEDYFNDNNKFSYQALSNKKDKTILPTYIIVRVKDEETDN